MISTGMKKKLAGLHCDSSMFILQKKQHLSLMKDVQKYIDSMNFFSRNVCMMHNRRNLMSIQEHTVHNPFLYILPIHLLHRTKQQSYNMIKVFI